MLTNSSAISNKIRRSTGDRSLILQTDEIHENFFKEIFFNFTRKNFVSLAVFRSPEVQTAPENALQPWPPGCTHKPREKPGHRARPCLPGVSLRVPAPSSNSEPGACLPAAVTASQDGGDITSGIAVLSLCPWSTCPRLPYNLTVSKGPSQEERYKHLT